MVTKIEWNDTYLLGIQEIDLQHKKLLSVANELYDTASGTEESYKLTMAKVLKSLTDYTVYHFSAEEAFMARYGYTGVSAHKVAHDGFIGEVENQIRKLPNGTKEDGLRFYSYIANWVLNHIAKADRVWASFVKPKL